VRLEWKGIDFPLGCHQCDPASCIAACPTTALTREQGTGAVLHDPDHCIGCKQCVVVCPNQAIHYDPARLELYKCDTCGGDPKCVQWCETEALRWEAGEAEADGEGEPSSELVGAANVVTRPSKPAEVEA